MSQLTPKQLKNATACEMYGKIAAMHLGKEKDPEYERRTNLKRALINALCNEDADEATKDWNTYMDEVYPSLPGVIAAATGNINRTKGQRFIDWFFKNGLLVESIDAEKEFAYADDSTVQVHIDISAVRDGSRPMNFILEWGTNPYSDKARKEENATKNSIELLSLMMVSDEGTDAAIAYLTSKDDKAGALVADFEMKPGKNMAMLNAEEIDLKEQFDHALHLEHSLKCSECHMKELCLARPYEADNTVPKAEKKDMELKLNPAQKLVVEAGKGPMLVLGAPGTGKTFTIVKSVMKLLCDGVLGSQIRVVTYTVNAANEFLSRIARASRGFSLPEVSTIHSLADEIVRKHDGVEVAKRLAEAEDVRIPLVIEALKRSPVIEGMSYDFPESPFGIFHRLDGIFRTIDLLGAEDALAEFKGDRDGVLRVYEQYHELFVSGGYFYYDWLIKRATEITAADRNFKNHYEYFIVDEFQDTTAEQFALIKNFVGDSHNIRCFGDDDQTIYQFGGASAQILHDFIDEYPEASVEYLEENNRSTAVICDLANGFIENNRSRFGKTMTAVKGEGVLPSLGRDFDDEKLIALLKTLEFAPEDVAILSRKNSPLYSLAQRMEREGLSANGPKQLLTETPEFQYLRMFLQFAEHRKDTPTQYLYRLLTYMGIKVECEGKKIYETYLADGKMPESLVEALRMYGCETAAKAMITSVFKALTGSDRIPAGIECLLSSLDENCVNDPRDVLPAIEKKVRYLDSTEVGYKSRKGAYNLLSAHRAKGKEWKCVIVYGLEDFGGTPGDNLEEETNLLYVAITRAEDVLIILNRTENEAPLQAFITGTGRIERRIA